MSGCQSNEICPLQMREPAIDDLRDLIDPRNGEELGQHADLMYADNTVDVFLRWGLGL